MKKIFIVVVLTHLIVTAGCAQGTPKEKNDAVKDKILRFFNAQNADSLYSLAGADFKKQLSEENFKGICDNNLFPLGEIRTVEFEKIEKGVSKYKATFDEVILSMYIGLDDAGMLETFLFQPYKKPATGSIVPSKTDNPLATALDKKVEEIMQPFMFESKTVGLSIGILNNGKTYFYNYGTTKRGGQQIPSSNNLYEIGSITKTFTGLLLAKAVTENKMQLNDPVNKYLPKNIPVIKFGNDTLKVVHLSNHSSGLPPLPDNFGATDLVNPYRDYDEQKLLDYLKHATLSRRPGEKFEYCNLGAGLLGYILEKVNKMPFEKMVTEFICATALMTDTRQLLLQKDSSLFMQGYNAQLAVQSQWDFKALAAAGALRSNTKDMLKYAAFNMETANKTLQKAIALSHQPTFEAGQQKIALNWFIQDWGWGPLLFHGGATGGYKSLLAINTATKNAIVLLSNTGVSNDEAGAAILKYIDK